MEAALSDGPHQYFDLPDNVAKIQMDPDTGRPASDGSQSAVTAFFKKGTEPR
jgi:membrane carboxypeptidase/penicillin-binding protein